MLATFMRGEGKHDQGRSFLATDAMPESTGLSVLLKHKQMALVDSFLTQCPKTAMNELTANASAAKRRVDSEMMNKAPPTVMAAQDGANQFLRRHCHKTQSRISVEELCDSGRRVCVA
jgi:hypothetical protein